MRPIVASRLFFLNAHIRGGICLMRQHIQIVCKLGSILTEEPCRDEAVPSTITRCLTLGHLWNFHYVDIQPRRWHFGTPKSLRGFRITGNRTLEVVLLSGSSL